MLVFDEVVTFNFGVTRNGTRKDGEIDNVTSIIGYFNKSEKSMTK